MADADVAGEHESPPIRVRTRDDDEVPWPRKAAKLSGTLKDWMDDQSEDVLVAEAFPVGRDISTTELRVLRDMCDPERDSSTALTGMSAIELLRLIEGANYLYATPALKRAQEALASCLAGKKAEELIGLLGAVDDLTTQDRAAARAEPSFTPAAGGAPAAPVPLQDLQRQPSMSVSITDNAKELALRHVDFETLTELKGVSAAWAMLARNELCLRLCCREGLQQQPPQQLSEISTLNVELLACAGRLWEVALAGRDLSSLVGLHGYGFEVNVSAVREADLPEAPPENDDEDSASDEDDENDAEGPKAAERFGGEALRACITGGGEAPLELKLAAVACAASGYVWGVPVARLRRNEVVGKLDVGGSWSDSYDGTGDVGARLLGLLLPAATSVLELRCRAL